MGKTESIIFGTSIKLSRVDKFEVECDGKVINPTSSVKYLGVTLDQTLNGESCANSVIRKASGRLSFLYRHGHLLNMKTRKTLCTALIQCHFDYCCSSWFSALSVQLKNKLQVMQNKMVRFILDLEPRSHIGSRELNQLGMLPVEARVKQLKLNHVFKIFHNTAPSYMSHNFKKVSEQHFYSTRGSATNFVVPKIRGQENNSFFKTGIQEWNSLTTKIKALKTKSQFKAAVKSFLSPKLS